MVESKFGLLKEGLLFNWLQSTMWERVSRYIREVGDAHLLLHEIIAAVHDKRVACAIFDDLQNRKFFRTR